MITQPAYAVARVVASSVADHLQTHRHNADTSPPDGLLPDAAVGTDQANKYVLVVAEDGTVSRRDVHLGPLYQGLRVIRSGVGAQDWVVTSGLQRARPGQKVTANREVLRLSAVRPGVAADRIPVSR